MTWFGDLSYRSVPMEEVSPGMPKCPVCGIEVPAEEWFRLTWVGSGPPPEGSGVCDPVQWRAETPRDPYELRGYGR